VRKRSDAEQADIAVARAAAGARGNILVRAFGRASEIADQPPLITLCAATFAAGLETGNRPLARRRADARGGIAGDQVQEPDQAPG